MSKNKSIRTINTSPVVWCLPGDNSGRGHYRIINPAVYMGKTGVIRPLINPNLFEKQQFQALNPDVVVWCAHERPAHHAAMKLYKSVIPSVHYVFDIDDWMLDIPDANVHKSQAPANLKETLKVSFGYADTITTTTEPLADAYRRVYHHSDIRVIPNRVPKEFTGILAKPSKERGKKPRVGWAGGISHTGDLAVISEVVQILKDEVQWVFFGMLPPGVSESEVEYHRSVPFSNYMEKLSTLDLDIALAPLEDHFYNTCKSNLRLLEYGLFGYTTIATDIEPYRNSPAILVQNSTENWVNKIRELAASGNVSEGAKLREWVLNKYVLEEDHGKHLKGWLPKNVEESFGPTKLAPAESKGYVVVGKSTLPVSHYDEFSQVPDNVDVLYIRPGTYISPADVVKLYSGIDDSTASSVPWTNGGGFASFPTLNTFVSVDQARIF